MSRIREWWRQRKQIVEEVPVEETLDVQISPAETSAQEELPVEATHEDGPAADVAPVADPPENRVELSLDDHNDHLRRLLREQEEKLRKQVRQLIDLAVEERMDSGFFEAVNGWTVTGQPGVRIARWQHSGDLSLEIRESTRYVTQSVFLCDADGILWEARYSTKQRRWFTWPKFHDNAELRIASQLADLTVARTEMDRIVDAVRERQRLRSQAARDRAAAAVIDRQIAERHALETRARALQEALRASSKELDELLA